jgi:hypothetical protein
MAIDYGKGVKKTNENISKANKAGKSLMGKNVMPVKPTNMPSTDMAPAKPKPKKK